MKKGIILVLLLQLMIKNLGTSQVPDYCAAFIANCKPQLDAYIDQVLNNNKCKQWTVGSCLGNDSKGMKIFRADKVIIGATDASACGGYSLYVQEGIKSKSLKIGNESFCDYVFAPDYPLMPLPTLRAYVQKEKHLPGFKSSKEIDDDGHIELSDIKLKQQEKIEEAFLYLIQMQKELDALQSEYDKLLAENQELKK